MLQRQRRASSSSSGAERASTPGNRRAIVFAGDVAAAERGLMQQWRAGRVARAALYSAGLPRGSQSRSLPHRADLTGGRSPGRSWCQCQGAAGTQRAPLCYTAKPPGGHDAAQPLLLGDACTPASETSTYLDRAAAQRRGGGGWCRLLRPERPRPEQSSRRRVPRRPKRGAAAAPGRAGCPSVAATHRAPARAPPRPCLPPPAPPRLPCLPAFMQPAACLLPMPAPAPLLQALADDLEHVLAQLVRL
jgi:hypothetical protein